MRSKVSRNKTTPSTKTIILKSRSQPLRSIQLSSRLPMTNQLTLQSDETPRSPTTRDLNLSRPRSSCLSVSSTSRWTRPPQPSKLAWLRFSLRPPQQISAQSLRTSKVLSGRTTWGRANSSQGLGWPSKTRNTVGEHRLPRISQLVDRARCLTPRTWEGASRCPTTIARVRLREAMTWNPTWTIWAWTTSLNEKSYNFITSIESNFAL